MNVSRKNCHDAFISFQKAAAECSFYSLDQEMSGIHCTELPETFWLDISEAYQRKRAVATRYVAIQLGISFFRPISSNSDSHEVTSFNFYARSSTQEIRFDPSAIEFHATNGFNFQSWITDSLPFLTVGGEAALWGSLFPQNNDDLFKRQADWLNELMPKLQKLIERNSTGEPLPEDQKELVLLYDQDLLSFQCRAALWYRLYWEKEREGFSENEFSNGVRPIIQHPVASRLPIQVIPSLLEFIPSRSRTVIRFRVVSLPEVNQELDNMLTERLADFHQRLGIRRFWRCLVQSKKPMVLHNGVTDLMFLMNQYHESLPATWIELKQQVNSLFLEMFDTKLLSHPLVYSEGDNSSPARTSLPEVYSHFVLDGKWLDRIKFPLGFEIDLSPKNHHNAVFDAFMTGASFLALTSLRGMAAVKENVNRLSSYGIAYDVDLNPSSTEHQYFNIVPIHIELPRFFKRSGMCLSLVTFLGMTSDQRSVVFEKIVTSNSMSSTYSPVHLQHVSDAFETVFSKTDFYVVKQMDSGRNGSPPEYFVVFLRTLPESVWRTRLQGNIDLLISDERFRPLLSDDQLASKITFSELTAWKRAPKEPQVIPSRTHKHMRSECI